MVLPAPQQAWIRQHLPGPLIFAIGNAPTALIRLYELIEEGKLAPALIIGVPVGFVNVVQAKELIMETDVPYIMQEAEKAEATWRQQSATHYYMILTAAEE